MTEPRRILEEDSAGLGASLLRAGKAYVPPASAHRRALMGVGLAAGASTATSATKAAGVLGALKAFAATKAGVTVLALGVLTVVGGGGAYAVTSSRATPAPSSAGAPTAALAGAPTAALPVTVAAVVPVPSSAPVAAAGAVEPPTPVTAPGPVASSVPVASDGARAEADGAPEDHGPSAPSHGKEVAPRSPAVASATTIAAPRVGAGVDPLADELAILDGARAAQRRSDFASALARLDDHDRRYAEGPLAQQAEIVRLEVLAASGNTAEARRRANRFLATHPRSALAGRAREIVAGLGT